MRQEESSSSAEGAGKEALRRQRELRAADGFLQGMFAAASSESLSPAPTCHLPRYQGTGCEGPRTPCKQNIRMRPSTSSRALASLGAAGAREPASSFLTHWQGAMRQQVPAGMSSAPSHPRSPSAAPEPPETPRTVPRRRCFACTMWGRARRGGKPRAQISMPPADGQPVPWGQPPAPRPHPLGRCQHAQNSHLGQRHPLPSAPVWDSWCRGNGSSHCQLDTRTPGINSKSQVG